MDLVYVLILISLVNGGYHTSMQEFNSKENCEAAKTVVQKTVYFVNSVCVKK